MSTTQVDATSGMAGQQRAGPRAGGEVAPVARYQPLVITTIAVGFGIVVDRSAGLFAPQSFQVWWLVAAASLSVWLLFWQRGQLIVAALALAVAIAACGGAWHHMRWNLFADDDLGRLANDALQPACIEVIAASAPQIVPPPPFDPLRTIPARTESRFVAEVVAIRDGFSWRPASGRSRVWLTGTLDELQVGDRLQVFAQLERPAPPANPGEFNFAEHARADRLLSVLRVEFPQCATVVGRASPWSISHLLNEARQSGNRLLRRYLSKDNTALASALLLGQREQIDRETNDAFLQTGTIHVLSISGLHVAILAWALFKAFRTGWMSRSHALLAVAAVTGVYMLLTGAEPPVVRATILVWIVCGSLLLGRSGVGLNSLALAALVIIALNPADLFRTGVLLSFLSVGVLIWVVPKVMPLQDVEPLDRLITATRPMPQRVATRFGHNMLRAFLIGAVMWFLIAPITMARFHLLSPVGLVLNLLLAPVVAILMGAGFGILLFGWIVPPLGAVFGWICNVCLAALDATVHSAAHWPGSYFWTPGPSDGWLVVLYIAALVTLIIPRATLPTRWRLAIASGWCGVALFVSLPLPRGSGELRCTFVSVGHGCAVVLELPDGKTLLYDAGRLGSPTAAEQSISNYLWSRKITHLDAVIVSHADADHYNALPGLLEKVSAGAIYVGPRMFEDDTPALRVLQHSFKRSGAKLGELFAGDRLKVDEAVKLEVLHPPAVGVAGSDNANSVVLLVEFGGKRILLTGDLESPGLESLMNEPRLNTDLVLAPHHGSSRSDPPGFAAWSLPEFVVVSCGRGDDATMVQAAYEARSASVMNTSVCGAVTAVISEGRLEVQPFRQPADLTPQ